MKQTWLPRLVSSLIFLGFEAACAPVSPQVMTPIESATAESAHSPDVNQTTIMPSPTKSMRTSWDFISSLFEKEDACQLPCQWGIIPGQTKWDEAQSFLSAYGAAFRDNGESVGGGKLIGVTLLYQRNNSGLELAHYQAYSVNRDGVIEWVTLGIPDFSGSQTFSSFMASYGQPDEVWVSTYKNDYQGGLPFDAEFVYWDEGSLISVSSGETTWDAQSNQGCFGSPLQVILYAWDKKKNMNFETVNKLFLASKYYLPIQDAAAITPEKFVDEILDGQNHACIRTPKSLWPEIQ